MRPITLIVVHCSASPNADNLFRRNPNRTGGVDTPVQVIDRWHAKRGFHRDPRFVARQNRDLLHVGYHYVLYRNGGVATGRHHDEIGAHAQGYNKNSFGICLVGTDQFTVQQWATLAHLVTVLKTQYPDARVVGHRDLSPDQNKNGIVEPFEFLKTCPGFDVAAWAAGGMAPLAANTFKEST